MSIFKTLIIVLVMVISSSLSFAQNEQEKKAMKMLGVSLEQLEKIQFYIFKMDKVDKMIKSGDWSVKVENNFSLKEGGKEFSNTLISGNVELYYDNSNLRKMVWTRGSGNTEVKSTFYYGTNGKLLIYGHEDSFEMKAYIIENEKIFTAFAAGWNKQTGKYDQLKPLSPNVKDSEFRKFKKLAATLPDLLSILTEQ